MMASEEDLLDDTTFKEYGDLEDLDADAEEALLGTGSDDELHGNENYAEHDNAGEEVEYVDEDGNPVEIGDGFDVEYVDYSGSVQDNEAHTRPDSIAEDVLDLAVDADLEFDDSVVQEDAESGPPQKKPRLPVSARLGQAVPLHINEQRHEGVTEIGTVERRSRSAEPNNDDTDEHVEPEVGNSASDADEEDEDDDDDEETSGRGRFHSERPKIVLLSTAKKRANIPDTLDGILQSYDSYRPDLYRDRRNRPNWEHSRPEQQQQQQRHRDNRDRANKERGPRSSHGNSSSSQSDQAISRPEVLSSSRTSHSSKVASSSPASSSTSQTSSLLGEPPNLLPCVTSAQRAPKEGQGSRKILINPHFKGSLNAPSLSSSSRASNWSEDRRGPPLLEAPPVFKQAAIANFIGSAIHQRPVEESTLMTDQKHQQQPYRPYSPTYPPPQPPSRPSLPPAHYVGVPVSNFQQHGSQIMSSPYSTVGVMPNTLGPPPPIQYQPPREVCGPPTAPQQQLHHPNGSWLQNVAPPVTHVQPEVKHVSAWTNPGPMMPTFSVAAGSNTAPQHWPPQQQPPQSYNPPMEQHQQLQQQQQQHQLPAISFPDMRQPPPNLSSARFNVPRVMAQQPQEIGTPWPNQMQQPKQLHQAPLIHSLPRFNHPPPPLLANITPSPPQFLVGSASPLRQLSPRGPLNNLRNGPNVMQNMRQRLPNANDLRNISQQQQQQQQGQSWIRPSLTGVGINVQTQFTRKRPLNSSFGLSGKVMKMSPSHQIVNRRQFQVSSNIKEVPIVDILPTPVIPRVSVSKPPAKSVAAKPAAIVPEDEDDETRQYRQKIELQTKQREEILRIKEQRRQLMALQRRKQLVEQQMNEGLGNSQQPAVVSPKMDNPKNAVMPNLKSATGQLARQQQMPPLSAVAGQPIMPFVSRVKKQVVVRRVPPSISGGQVTSPRFVVQQPGFVQQMSQPRFPVVVRAAPFLQTRPQNPVSVAQMGSRPALVQRVVPIKQNQSHLPKGTTFKPNIAASPPAVASTSKVKPIGQQPSDGAPPRCVVRNVANLMATAVQQSAQVSPNIVSLKFPAQAVNTETKKTAVTPNNRQQQKVAVVKQNVQPRTVIASQGAKRTVIMNSADVKLVQQQQLQQPVQAGGQQTQRRVLATTNVPARVRIDNLALSTSEIDVQKLCKNVGPVEDVVLHRDRRTALVTFRNQQHAHEFMSKYQRRMLDLSLMNISMVT